MNPAALFLSTKSNVFNPDSPDHEMWETLSLWAENNQSSPDYILFRTRWLISAASDFRNRKSLNREEDQAIADALRSLRSIRDRIIELNEKTLRFSNLADEARLATLGSEIGQRVQRLLELQHGISQGPEAEAPNRMISDLGPVALALHIVLKTIWPEVPEQHLVKAASSWIYDHQSALDAERKELNITAFRERIRKHKSEFLQHLRGASGSDDSHAQAEAFLRAALEDDALGRPSPWKASVISIL